MRNLFEVIQIKVYDLAYSLQNLYNSTSTRTKLSALSFFFLMWLIPSVFIIQDARTYKPNLDAPVQAQSTNVGADLIEEAENLIAAGEKSEAFDQLIIGLNNFRKYLTESQVEFITLMLEELKVDAVEISIDDLYAKEDLEGTKQLYLIKGTVIAVNTDDMYGDYFLVSGDGDKYSNQLEVYGLGNVSAGAQVFFFGVPRFSSVASPMTVEAYTSKLN